MNILIQCGDHLENQKRILPLAIKLKENNFNPVVLVYTKPAMIFFLSRGIDAVSLNLVNESKNIKNNLRRRISLSSSIKDDLYRELNIKTIIECEKLKNYTIDIGPRKKVTYLNVMTHIDALYKIINIMDIKRILIWNGYTGFVANILRCIVQKKNLPCLYMERGLKKDSLFIDPKGVNGFSKLHTMNTDIVPLSATNIDITKKFNRIFVPLQVQNDTNIIFNSPIKTMREFILHVYELYLRHGINLIVRPHPEEVETDLNLPNLPGITYTSSESVDYWINHTDATVTINSTVGMEALIKNKITFSFGKSIYSNKNICIPVSSGIDLINKFKFATYKISNGQDFLSFLEKNNTVYENNSCSVLDDFIYKNKALKNTTFTIKTNNNASEIKQIYPPKYVRVYTDLTHNCRLNLTYRKNNELITPQYIYESLSNLFGKKYSPYNCTIFKSYENKIKDHNEFSIFISKHNDTPLEYSLCLDRYMNILKINSTKRDGI